MVKLLWDFLQPFCSSLVREIYRLQHYVHDVRAAEHFVAKVLILAVFKLMNDLKHFRLSNFVSQDYIDILFEQPVYPWSIAIYETYNPGALVRILALCQEFPKQKSSRLGSSVFQCIFNLFWKISCLIEYDYRKTRFEYNLHIFCCLLFSLQNYIVFVSILNFLFLLIFFVLL